MKPFPIAINKGVGCYDRYETPQDAIDAGLLPSNWVIVNYCCKMRVPNVT